MAVKTLCISGVVLSGEIAGEAFITKDDMMGDYVAYTAIEPHQELERNQSKVELVKKYRPSKPKAKENTDKVLHIGVLPMQQRLPQGHILRLAMQGEKVVGAIATSYNDEVEMNGALAEFVNKAAEKGYSVKLTVNARVNYRDTTSNFRRNAQSAMEFIQRSRPQTQAFEAPQEELPF